MRLSLGVSNVAEDAVLAVPVNKLVDAPASMIKGGFFRLDITLHDFVIFFRSAQFCSRTGRRGATDRSRWPRDGATTNHPTSMP